MSALNSPGCLYDKKLTVTKCMEYTGVLINRFHCIYKPLKLITVVV